MSIPTRTEIARTLRYMRRHTRMEFFHDPHERNIVTIEKMLWHYNQHSPEQIRRFLTQMDAAKQR